MTTLGPSTVIGVCILLTALVSCEHLIHKRALELPEDEITFNKYQKRSEITKEKDEKRDFKTLVKKHLIRADHHKQSKTQRTKIQTSGTHKGFLSVSNSNIKYTKHTVAQKHPAKASKEEKETRSKITKGKSHKLSKSKKGFVPNLSPSAWNLKPQGIAPESRDAFIAAAQARSFENAKQYYQLLQSRNLQNAARIRAWQNQRLAYLKEQQRRMRQYQMLQMKANPTIYQRPTSQKKGKPKNGQAGEPESQNVNESQQAIKAATSSGNNDENLNEEDNGANEFSDTTSADGETEYKGTRRKTRLRKKHRKSEKASRRYDIDEGMSDPALSEGSGDEGSGDSSMSSDMNDSSDSEKAALGEEDVDSSDQEDGAQGDEDATAKEVEESPDEAPQFRDDRDGPIDPANSSATVESEDPDDPPAAEESNTSRSDIDDAIQEID